MIRYVNLKGNIYTGKLIREDDFVISIAAKNGTKYHFSKQFVDILSRNPIKLKVKE